MVAERNGGGGSSIHHKVRCAVSASVHKTEDIISARLRQSCVDEPSSGTNRLFALAMQNMETLRPKIGLSKAFLFEARERRTCGKLDDDTLKAELAPVNMAIALYGSLKIMLERAKDKSAFQLIGWASGTLTRNIEAGGALLHKTTYPPDASLRKKLVDGRKKSAMDLYNSVMKDDVKALAETLGVATLPPELIMNAQ